MELRTIELRQGLNIIWSPDPADRPGGSVDDDDEPLGHGTGKTLFCRLLRYCLGEERFATDDGRRRILATFPEGRVGAEVVIDGTSWAVVRSIGLARHDAASSTDDLMALARRREADRDGWTAYVATLQRQLITEDVAALVPSEGPHHAWLVALAWLARDQEARFGKLLEWRVGSSNSASPAAGLSAPRRLDATRALLGALRPEELALTSEQSKLERSLLDIQGQAGHTAWLAKQITTRLASTLGVRASAVPPERHAIEFFKRLSRENLAQAAKVDVSVDVSDLDALRSARDDARRHETALKVDLARLEGQQAELQLLLRVRREEANLSSAALLKAGVPVCPVCEVAVDRALLEGCKLSHKVPDLDAVRERREAAKRELEEVNGRRSDNERAQANLRPQLESACARAKELDARCRAVEKNRDARTKAWEDARQVLRDTERLEEVLRSHDEIQAAVRDLKTKLAASRERGTAYREEARAQVFTVASMHFDAIARELTRRQSKGELILDSNGLDARIAMGGQSSAIAKVVAFDLTALCMSIEGRTHLPAFLVHDCPRETDLSLTLYHRLFRFARALENVGPAPLFQYIVTTTTRPPDELATTPWLRMTFRSDPADDRLLGRSF